MELAKSYREGGAQWLHIVDLVASRDGELADTKALFKLLNTAPQKVQTGGGIRSGGDVQARLDQGASRVVVGSLCVTETRRVIRWIDGFGPDAIVAALDVRIDKDGVPRPRIYGWTEGSDISLWSLLERLKDGGLIHALVTDISRDGAMKGPNIRFYRELAGKFPGLKIQASGGVGTYDDLVSVAHTGADAVIVGKALLEGNVTVAGALDVLQ